MVKGERWEAREGASEKGLPPYQKSRGAPVRLILASAWGLRTVLLADADPGRIVGLDPRHGGRAVELGVVRDRLGYPAVLATADREWPPCRSGSAAVQYDQRQE